MHYTQNYYSQAKARSDKLQKEIAERKASLNEAEAAKEAKQSRKELDQIIARMIINFILSYMEQYHEN